MNNIYIRIGRGIIYLGIFFIALGIFTKVVEKTLAADSLGNFIVWLGFCAIAFMPVIVTAFLSFLAWQPEK